jgi:hypothetical protein
MLFLQLYTLFGRAAMFYIPYNINISVPGCCTSVAAFLAKERYSNKFSLRSHQEMGM